jgi:antitoxin (DNA-binding transcriptional repressor) of toxin-antitoxin stability system
MNEVVRVGVRELRGNLTAYLRQAQQGASILVTSHDQVIAELRPPPPEQRPRRVLGSMRGKIRVAPDFDEWPPGFIDMMEGNGKE